MHGAAAWGLAVPLVFLGAALNVGAGIGGGATFVAIYFLVLGEDAHGAVPLSKATIFGLSLAAFAVNIWKRHPHDPKRPLIDYDTAMMLEPMTLLGGILGVILNVIFPNWLVLLPLCLLLGFISYKTLKKAWNMHKKELAARIGADANKPALEDSDKEQLMPADDAEDDEASTGLVMAEQLEKEDPSLELTMPSDARRSIAVASNGDDDANLGLQGSSSTDFASLGDEGSMRQVAVEDGPDAMAALRAALERDDHRLAKWDRILMLGAVWIGYFVLTFLLYRAEDAVPRCEAGWVVLLLCSIPYVVGVTYLFARRLHRQTIQKKAVGYVFHPGDVMWEGRNLYYYPEMAFFAGLCASMMGIGGGLIKSPLMLSMGLNPQTTTTTSSFMIIFTSSASTFQVWLRALVSTPKAPHYLILGKLHGAELAAVMASGFAGALMGQKVVNHLVQKYQKQSLLMFLLGGLTVLSVVILFSLAIADGKIGKGGFAVDEFCLRDTNSTN
ncbi:uncharacterized protein MONBRDRAFT_26471 [Monosiga brevicollis MX1]|uniref:Uncharacterized protein n=1 Tax=Monosiga brevicollis TaxID=81824 RepID=A9V2G5_MONBE|nr:uncharacterized protein MONBRDRAFT_26471 [Monosiga brevicollis MX1]EDQ88372.1 predicted protein [Monosiga brevicollis MX1]|eukprot:XP_001746965.1 hypothetical protein [Monosiga brevicollis MX1]